MAKFIRVIILTAIVSVLAWAPRASADTMNPDSQPVSVFVTPGPQTGGNANGNPVSVFVTPGPQTGGNVNGNPVSVFVTPGPQTGGNANSKPVSVYIQQLKDVVPGLVGYWPMDGDWNDHSGNGYNGTPYNGVTFNTTDYKGGSQSGSFDGVDDYVAVPTLWLNPPDALTVEAWIKAGTGTSDVVAFYHGDNGEFELYYQPQTNKVAFRTKLSNGTWYSILANSPSNDWHHVAGVFEKGNNLTIYIDGIFQASIPIPNYPLWNPGTGYLPSIGAYNRGSAEYSGLVDELAVFNRALSADEIKAHYLNGIVPGLHAPIINQVTSPTPSPNSTFSGTKDIGASIWINGVQAVASDSSVTWQTPYTLSEGLNILKFSEHDASQNVSPEVVVSVVLDTISPAAGSLVINSETGYTNSASVTLKLNATDSGSGVASMQFSNDNSTWSGWETYASSKAWAVPTGDGIKTVYARFMDAAGNVSQVISSTVTLDTVPPATPAIATYTALTNQTSQTVSGTRSSGASGVILTVNGTALPGTSVTYQSATTWSAQVTGLVAGDNSLTATAVDAAGNQSAPSAAIKITVDKNAPVWNSETGIGFIEPGDGQAIVRWDSATDKEGAEVSYNIYESTVSPIDFTTAVKVSIPIGFSGQDYAGKGYDYQYTLTGLTGNRRRCRRRLVHDETGRLSVRHRISGKVFRSGDLNSVITVGCSLVKRIVRAEPLRVEPYPARNRIGIKRRNLTE